MNNKWYQSAPCKGILIVLEHILAVVMITCLVLTFSYPGDNLAGILLEKPHKKYEQSKGFTDKLMSAANDITAAEGYDSNFETEGKYDENRIVDLKEYDSDRKISNENVNGLAYRLGDLVNYWENDQEMYYADGTKMADGDNDDEIIVCQKDDGTYHYYYEKEFRREFKNGNLQFGNMDEAKDEYSLESTGEVIDSLINDWIESSASIYRNILDSENRQVYTKCWRYDGEKVSENCAPVGAKNLLEVVNKDSRWNGKLSDAMSLLGNTVDSVRNEFLTWQYVTEEYKEGNTNLAYMIVDLDNKKVYTNRLAYQRFDEWEKNLESMKKLGVYAVATPKLTEYQSDIDMDGSQWKSLIGGNMWMDNYECVFAVDTSYPIQDDFYQESKIYQEYAPQVRFTFWIAIATGFAMLVILAWLTIVAGRSNRETKYMRCTAPRPVHDRFCKKLSPAAFSLNALCRYCFFSSLFHCTDCSRNRKRMQARSFCFFCINARPGYRPSRYILLIAAWASSDCFFSIHALRSLRIASISSTTSSARGLVTR